MMAVMGPGLWSRWGRDDEVGNAAVAIFMMGIVDSAITIIE